MDKRYDPSLEEKIYQKWLDANIFTPQIPQKTDRKTKPFSIILPPPNANNPLHAGHALFTVEDILIRYHRMLGDTTLWLPGTDHAGIETQFVFEKHLQKDGKSRFDYDSQTLFKMISDFVDENKDIAIKQMKRLGFSLDWSRLKFTMDKDHIDRVYFVFQKMVKDGLIYRDEKIVNYCTFCGTAFSNLEVTHKTVNSHLWYINYGPLTVATTRPETMLGDTAVAVHPTDKRYQKLIGTTLTLPLVDRLIPIIADSSIDPDFGTGAVKVTPSHSPEDYDMAKKHNLDFIRIFDYDGLSNQNVPKKYQALYPKQLRAEVIKDLEAQGLLQKTVKYSHEVGHCYKCGRPIEPITAPQWFVKIKPLADKAVDAVKTDQVTIFPKRFKKQFLNWMKDIYDWPISRQIVWGHRIPAWYCLDDNPSAFNISFIDSHQKVISGTWQQLSKTYKSSVVKSGLQTIMAGKDVPFYLSEADAKKHGSFVLQETDTFDTWFSSGQWPYSVLGWSPDGNHSKDFLYFYPTSVLDTMWDILFFWVARMIMMSIYVTGQIPFKVAHMHSRVNDANGQKMSKSKGNVINPTVIAKAYGADALRMALVFGVAPGSDISLSQDKILAHRNFVNKIWNASRFVFMIADKFLLSNPDLNLTDIDHSSLNQDDKNILEKLEKVIKSTTKNIEKYRFGQASQDLYTFFWHDFCDTYIEQTKNRGQQVVPVLFHVLLTSLKLLHPFIPFVTESVYQEAKIKLNLKDDFIATSIWPKVEKK